MRVLSFMAENVKRLRAVEITPEGDVVVITGKNAQGKTSVLDAIWMALGGGPASKGTTRPVRDGEESAFVELDLGDLRVRREWDKDGKTFLRVSSADGAKYSSPQTMLDSLVGRISFDPLAFAGQDEKGQVATLLDLVELPFDVDELARKRQTAYDDRRDASRDLKALQAQLAGLPAHDIPEGAGSIEEVIAERDKALAHNEAIYGIIRSKASVDNEIESLSGRADRLRDELDLIERLLEEEEARKERLTDEGKTFGDPIDVSVFDERLRVVESYAAVRASAVEREKLEANVGVLAATVGNLTTVIEETDRMKRDGIAAAEMPIEGLSFDETGVIYNDVPFAQCSAAERLRVSVAMAMAMNPEIRVIRIVDGSLLDPDNLALISEMAAERDFQVWIEKVAESEDAVGVYIEDGAVRS